MKVLVSSLVLLCTVGTVLCYNVLIFSLGISGSQNLIMYRLGEAIALRGHKVTMLKEEINKYAKTPKVVNVNEITVTPKLSEQSEKVIYESMQNAAWVMQDENPLVLMQKMGALFYEGIVGSCRVILEDEKLMARLTADKYDVVVIHLVDLCGYGVAERLGVKSTIWMSTGFMMDFQASYSFSPSPASWVPSVGWSGSNEMSFTERFTNAMVGVGANLMFELVLIRGYDDLFQELYGPSFPSTRSLVLNTQLYFVNSDPLFEYPRPYMSNVISVGGLTMSLPEPLDGDWLKLLESERSDKYGVVVWSLGTVANTTAMPMEIKTMFFNVFKSLKQTVIWRVEGGVPEGVKDTPNIRVTKWIPQKDLLAHKNVRLFITHGGYNSLTEATYLGVPLMVFSLFGDQIANAKRVIGAGIGETVHKVDVTEEKISRCVNTLLSDEKYLRNARRLGKMIQTKPISSAELAVKWVEFLAEFKTIDNFSPPAKHMNTFQCLMLDIIATCLAISILFIFISLKCLKFVVRKVCGSKPTSTKRKPKRE